MTSQRKEQWQNEEPFALGSLLQKEVAPWVANDRRAGNRSWVVERVVEAILPWARSQLRDLSPWVLEEVAQEFCSNMMKHRPDLLFDEKRGKPGTLLRCVLRNTRNRYLRGDRSDSAPDEVDFDLAEAAWPPTPEAGSEAGELYGLLVAWMWDLPPAERTAAQEVASDATCQCPSARAHAVRLCRALHHLREMAGTAGLFDPPGNAARRRGRIQRPPRSRRPRVRMVRRLGQRFAPSPAAER